VSKQRAENLPPFLPFLLPEYPWVEPTPTQEATYQHIRPVCRSHHSDAGKLFYPVHLVQQACQNPGMSAIIVSSRPECVDLVLKVSVAHISSTQRTKRMIDGDAALALRKISRTARSDSPTYLFRSCHQL